MAGTMVIGGLMTGIVIYKFQTSSYVAIANFQISSKIGPNELCAYPTVYNGECLREIRDSCKDILSAYIICQYYGGELIIDG